MDVSYKLAVRGRKHKAQHRLATDDFNFDIKNHWLVLLVV